MPSTADGAPLNPVCESRWVLALIEVPQLIFQKSRNIIINLRAYCFQFHDSSASDLSLSWISLVFFSCLVSVYASPKLVMTGEVTKQGQWTLAISSSGSSRATSQCLNQALLWSEFKDWTGYQGYQLINKCHVQRKALLMLKLMNLISSSKIQ